MSEFSSSDPSAVNGEPDGRPSAAVYVRFSPSQGPRLRQESGPPCSPDSSLWEERPILMKRADCHFELIGITTDVAGVARWVLSHGADAKVEGPERLQRRVVSEARRVVALYEDACR